jgi:hypothetical protein
MKETKLKMEPLRVLGKRGTKWLGKGKRGQDGMALS